jgi:hypothetical protein
MQLFGLHVDILDEQSGHLSFAKSRPRCVATFLATFAPSRLASHTDNTAVNWTFSVRCSHKALTCDKGEVFSWRPRVNETLTAVCPQLLVGQLVPDLGVGRNEDRPQEH